MISENCWNVNLTQVFLSSHITRSVRCWSLFKAHESLLVYQFLAFVKLGPFHISEKGFYLDKFHVIINILQVQLDFATWQILAEADKSSNAPPSYL